MNSSMTAKSNVPIFKNKSWEIAMEKGGDRTSGFDFFFLFF